MNVVAPAHLNLAYTLLFWRIHDRSSFIKFVGELIDNRLDWWDGKWDACKFITERMASALCSEGVEGNIVADLNLYNFFGVTKPIDAAFKIHQLVNYISRSRYIDGHIREGLNINETYERLLEHLAADGDEEPFFYTPTSVARFISTLAIFFHRTFVGRDFDDEPLTIYDPNPGYGEITWSMANVSNKEMNIAYTTDSVGDDSIMLPALCYRFINKTLNERNRFNPLVDLFNQIDIIATNPLHAWLPQYCGFTWKTIYDHLNALKEGEGIYVTTCPVHMFNWQPICEEERSYKREVICGRCLKIIVKLPPNLLRGCREAPLILVFSNTPQKHKLHCLDLTEIGIKCSRVSGRIITGGEFNRLFSPYKDDEGFGSLFAYYTGDTWDACGPTGKMKVGALDDVNELLADGIKFDDLFFDN